MDVEGAGDQVTPQARRKERRKLALVTRGQQDEVAVASGDVDDSHPGITVEGVDVEDVDPMGLREHPNPMRRAEPQLPMMRRNPVKVAMEKEGVAADEVEVVEDAVGALTAVVVEEDSLVVSIVAGEDAAELVPTVPVIKKSILGMRIKRRSQPTAPTELPTHQQHQAKSRTSQIASEFEELFLIP